MIRRPPHGATKYNPNKIQYYNWRFRIVLTLIGLVFLGLIGRLLYLMVIDRAFLQRQGDMRAVRTIEMPAYRGIIADRNGSPLAVSTPVYAVWVDPKSFKASQQQIISLSKLIKESPRNISQDIEQNKKREFIYLKRQLPPEIGDAINNLNIPGVFVKEEYRRFYPEGPVVAHVVGLTNVDDSGQEGLELGYNSWLQGVSGLRRVIQDRYGHIVSDVNLLRQPVSGKNLVLSIDKRIQYVAYRELSDQVEKFQADSGSIVVLDSRTGEILAMANVPSYNPNDRPKIHDGRFRNRAVTDTFEPGSTIKPFSMVVALTSGKYTPDSMINVAPYSLNGHLIHDDHPKTVISATEVLKYSSNVGISHMVLSLSSPLLLPQFLSQMGFGKKTPSGFPGESSGNLPVRDKWAPFTLATLTFGYGLSATVLQLAQAYTAFANDGVELPVSFLKLSQAPQGKRVFSEKVGKQMVPMLEAVVEQEGGTAKVPGYWVAGKTGTARIVGAKGYLWNHHNALFAGFAPATDPRLVIVVYIHDPRKLGYYGNSVAGPVFARVMAASLRMLDVPPDNLNDQNAVKTAKSV